ncbi:MAG: hypothetical protein V3S28_05755 [Acidimicrobiia bacterium]
MGYRTAIAAIRQPERTLETGRRAFTGTIEWVQVDLDDGDVSHLEDPEQTYHRIMAPQ